MCGRVYQTMAGNEGGAPPHSIIMLHCLSRASTVACLHRCAACDAISIELHDWAGVASGTAAIADGGRGSCRASRLLRRRGKAGGMRTNTVTMPPKHDGTPSWLPAGRCHAWCYTPHHTVERKSVPWVHKNIRFLMYCTGHDSWLPAGRCHTWCYTPHHTVERITVPWVHKRVCKIQTGKDYFAILATTTRNADDSASYSMTHTVPWPPNVESGSRRWRGVACSVTRCARACTSQDKATRQDKIGPTGNLPVFRPFPRARHTSAPSRRPASAPHPRLMSPVPL